MCGLTDLVAVRMRALRTRDPGASLSNTLRTLFASHERERVRDSVRSLDALWWILEAACQTMRSRWRHSPTQEEERRREYA